MVRWSGSRNRSVNHESSQPRALPANRPDRLAVGGGKEGEPVAIGGKQAADAARGAALADAVLAVAAKSQAHRGRRAFLPADIEHAERAGRDAAHCGRYPAPGAQLAVRGDGGAARQCAHRADDRAASRRRPRLPVHAPYRKPLRDREQGGRPGLQSWLHLAAGRKRDHPARHHAAPAGAPLRADARDPRFRETGRKSGFPTSPARNW